MAACCFETAPVDGVFSGGIRNACIPESPSLVRASMMWCREETNPHTHTGAGSRRRRMCENRGHADPTSTHPPLWEAGRLRRDNTRSSRFWLVYGAAQHPEATPNWQRLPCVTRPLSARSLPVDDIGAHLPATMMPQLRALVQARQAPG